MKVPIICVIILSSLFTASCQNPKPQNSSKYWTAKLEIAEKSKEITLINELFAEDGIILYPDGMLVVGKEAIISMYRYLWSNTNVETLSYLPESASVNKDEITETGRYVFSDNEKNHDAISYQAIFLKSDEVIKLRQIAFGERNTLMSKLPELPKPTGEYKVGQSTFFLC